MVDNKPSRFLIVDDERHVVRLIQVNLERNGYQVAVALNGNDAIARLQTGTFDRAIIDYDMPAPSGYDVLEFIRTHEHTEDMWVGLMVSAANLAEVESRPYKADWYSAKPFHPDDLLE